MVEIASRRSSDEPLVSLGAVVGLNVRRRRKDLGISQEELADRLTAYGLSWQRQRVVELEAGRRPGLPLGELLTLVAACQTTVLDLLQSEADILLYPVPAILSPAKLDALLGATPADESGWWRLLLRVVNSRHVGAGGGEYSTLSWGPDDTPPSREEVRHLLPGRAEMEGAARQRGAGSGSEGDDE